MARLVREQRAAQLERIAAAELREFVEHTVHHEAGVQ